MTLEADTKLIEEIWQLPGEQRRFVLQDQYEEWGSDRYFLALWHFAKGYKK